MNPTTIFDKLIDNVQTTGGAAGVLALLITGTLCAVYFRKPHENPDIGKALIYALTTIIGFYFGTAAATKNPSQAPPVAVSPR